MCIRDRLETYFRVSVPAAKSGIAAAVVLGVGRAIGEAMAILMVAGNVANMPSLLSSVKFLTTAIASEMSYAAVGSLQRNALYSIGLILFLFIMCINVILNVFLKRNKEGLSLIHIFGPGGEHGSYPQVVGPRRLGGQGLLHRACGHADEFVFPQQGPDSPRLHIALAHVDAVLSLIHI